MIGCGAGSRSDSPLISSDSGCRVAVVLTADGSKVQLHHGVDRATTVHRALGLDVLLAAGHRLEVRIRQLAVDRRVGYDDVDRVGRRRPPP